MPIVGIFPSAPILIHTDFIRSIHAGLFYLQLIQQSWGRQNAMLQQPCGKFYGKGVGVNRVNNLFHNGALTLSIRIEMRKQAKQCIAVRNFFQQERCAPGYLAAGREQDMAAIFQDDGEKIVLSITNRVSSFSERRN